MAASFPDRLAVHILTALTAPHLRASSGEGPPATDLLAALADTFGPPPAAAAPTSAELARAALAIAYEDPKTREALDHRLESATPPTYGVVETTAVLTAALAVLQTEVTFAKTPAGKWTVKLHKRAASDALLKALAHAIMRALSAGGEPGHGAPRLPK